MSTKIKGALTTSEKRMDRIFENESIVEKYIYGTEKNESSDVDRNLANPFPQSSYSHAIPFQRLFFDAYGKVPSTMDFDDVTAGAFKILDEFKKKLKVITLNTDYNFGDDKFTHDCSLFELEEGVWILFAYENDNGFEEVRLIFEATKDVKKYVDYLKQFKKEVNVTGQLKLVTATQHGLSTRDFDIKDPQIDLDLNYNDDLMEVYQTMIDRLNQDKDKGIILLHGVPGGGKTTFLRHLIHQVKKQKLYVPPDLAHQIASPEFIPFLESKANSILFIEDAESILLKRGEGDRNQAVANLLNLGDGLLADCLNIQIVATFNTNVSNIDEALLRKGRLIAKYEFKELEETKGKKLAKSLGFDETLVTGDQTLADIYNLNDKSFKNERKSVGFK